MLKRINPCILKVEELSQRIDHAVLKPWSSVSELEKALHELEQYNLRCLVLSPTLLEYAREKTRKCLGAVVGFPFGYHTVEAKIKELEDSIALGANEIDYVANLQKLVLGKYDEYMNEIKAVITVCRSAGVKCKIIIEAPALTKEQLVKIVKLIASLKEPPDFIKTSTGYGPRPTYPEDVYLIHATLVEAGVREHIGIKAAGGIREGIQASLMISVGADVIGTSTPANIIESYRKHCSGK